MNKLNKYLIDHGVNCWYVYNRKTNKVTKTLGTRAEARRYAKRRNK